MKPLGCKTAPKHMAYQVNYREKKVTAIAYALIFNESAKAG